MVEDIVSIGTNTNTVLTFYSVMDIRCSKERGLLSTLLHLQQKWEIPLFFVVLRFINYDNTSIRFIITQLHPVPHLWATIPISRWQNMLGILWHWICDVRSLRNTLSQHMISFFFFFFEKLISFFCRWSLKHALGYPDCPCSAHTAKEVDSKSC